MMTAGLSVLLMLISPATMEKLVLSARVSWLLFSIIELGVLPKKPKAAGVAEDKIGALNSATLKRSVLENAR